MAIGHGRDKIEGGQGGRRGHSNMDHRVYTHELKEFARKARRLDAREVVRAEIGELDDVPPRTLATRRPASTPRSGRTHPNAAAFPKGLSGPALRALKGAGIRSMSDLARWRETDLAALHGMGPKALRILKAAQRPSARAVKRRLRKRARTRS